MNRIALYKRMDEIIAETDIVNIAFADLVEEKKKVVVYVDDINEGEAICSYETISNDIEDFCLYVEELSHGGIRALRLFDDILDGYVDEDYTDIEEEEDDYGHYWSITKRVEVVIEAV
jgi:hypothetical protein